MRFGFCNLGTIFILASGLFSEACHRESNEAYRVSEYADDHLEGDPSDLANQAVNSKGLFGAKSKDLFTNIEYVQTGATPREAFQLALEECLVFDDGAAGCVVLRVYDTVLSPNVDGTIFKEWNCYGIQAPPGGTPKINRTWMGAGKTLSQAQEAAVSNCQAAAGLSCVPGRCFNTDYEKVFVY
jgi:hypothetical protein